MRISDWSSDVCSSDLVGGPCLEKDPHILLASVAPKGVSLEITAASRLVNERQPGETVNAAIARASERAKGPLTVLVSGIAFKGRPETDDLRGSMSLHVIERLRESGKCAEIRLYDRSEEHTSELQSLMRISYAVFCL